MNNFLKSMKGYRTLVAAVIFLIWVSFQSWLLLPAALTGEVLVSAIYALLAFFTGVGAIFAGFLGIRVAKSHVQGKHGQEPE